MANMNARWVGIKLIISSPFLDESTLRPKQTKTGEGLFVFFKRKSKPHFDFKIETVFKALAWMLYVEMAKAALEI